MNKTYYVCKYTPIELLESLGGECENFNHMPEGFDLADQVSHPNMTFCLKAASWIFSIFWMCFTVTVPVAESVWLYS